MIVFKGEVPLIFRSYCNFSRSDAVLVLTLYSVYLEMQIENPTIPHIKMLACCFAVEC